MGRTNHIGSWRALALGMTLALAGCGDNLTPPPQPEAFVPDTPAPLECLPDLDGQITADELQAALGVPVRYLVNPTDEVRQVDLAGVVDPSGRRVWDWTDEADTDQLATLQAAALDDQWFAGDFPGGQFVAPVDAGGRVLGVYSHDGRALRLHGVASSQSDPPEGRSLLPYQSPVDLYRFPLEVGDGWVSVGEVRGGTLRGLPYAGRDVYEVEVRASGELRLPDVSFTQALQVHTRVTLEPAVGASVSQRQVSFLFECFGEVARATSQPDEPDEDFTSAAEIRRLGF